MCCGCDTSYIVSVYIQCQASIYTFFVSRAFMAGAAGQAGDNDSSRAPGLTSGLQGSVNVHRGAVLLVPQWQCIISFVFYIAFLYLTYIIVFKANAHSYKVAIYFAALLFKIMFLSMRLLPRINAMLDFICMATAELQANRNYKRKKKIPQWDSNPRLARPSVFELIRIRVLEFT